MIDFCRQNFATILLGFCLVTILLGFSTLAIYYALIGVVGRYVEYIGFGFILTGYYGLMTALIVSLVVSFFSSRNRRPAFNYVQANKSKRKTRNIRKTT